MKLKTPAAMIARATRERSVGVGEFPDEPLAVKLLLAVVEQVLEVGMSVSVADAVAFAAGLGEPEIR